MNQTTRMLITIPSTEPGTWYEYLSALGDDKPAKGDKPAWHGFYLTLESFETSGLVEIERRDGKIETLILTELGAERAREALQER